MAAGGGRLDRRRLERRRYQRAQLRFLLFSACPRDRLMQIARRESFSLEKEPRAGCTASNTASNTSINLHSRLICTRKVLSRITAASKDSLWNSLPPRSFRPRDLRAWWRAEACRQLRRPARNGDRHGEGVMGEIYSSISSGESRERRSLSPIRASFPAKVVESVECFSHHAARVVHPRVVVQGSFKL